MFLWSVDPAAMHRDLIERALETMKKANHEQNVGSVWADFVGEMLQRARAHCAEMEETKKQQDLREAERYLLEKYGVEGVQGLLERDGIEATSEPSGEAMKRESKPCSCALTWGFGGAWRWASAGACAGAKRACVAGACPQSGTCWFGRMVQQSKNGCAIRFVVKLEVNANARPAKVVFCGTANSANPPAVNGVCELGPCFPTVSCPAGVNGCVCPKACCPMAVRMQDVPLMTALDHLRAATGCQVAIDAEGLHKAGVSPTDPVSVNVQGMPLYCTLDLMLRPHRLQAWVCGDTIHVTCTGECRAAAGEKADPAACEEVCPKCAAMHAKAMRMREEAAKKLLVDGLMKACRLAIADGRYVKAAELARQAYAVDPERVESEPMVIKLDLLEGCRPRPVAPKVQVLTGAEEESEKGADGETKLTPHLPGTFADVVGAMEAIEAEKPKR
jgi:hypothetical protein